MPGGGAASLSFSSIRVSTWFIARAIGTIDVVSGNGGIVEACVAQRSVDVLVAQDGLDCQDRRACVDEQGGTGVAELVRRNVHATAVAVGMQPVTTISARQWPMVVDEDVIGRHRTAQRQVGVECLEGNLAEKDDTIFEALGLLDANAESVQVEV